MNAPPSGAGPDPRDRLVLVAAATAEGVIGRGDGMPWSVPEEYAHYLSLVRGHPIVLGRRSFEIFGADLAGETLVVLSRGGAPLAGAHAVVPSLAAALALPGVVGRQTFVAGGAAVYALALPHADALYLSEILEHHAGDARFPELDRDEWRVEHEARHARFVFRVLRRAVAWTPPRGAGAVGG